MDNTGLGLIDSLIVIAYMAVMLLISKGFMGRQKNAREFFVASGTAPWWAVGVSILVTLFSTVSITGGPAEFFEYGLRGFGIWWIASLLCAPVILFVFIRVFMRIGIMTAYEYLERRFAMPVRVISGVFFLSGRGLYIGVVLYSSAIVLGAAFGNRLDLVTLIVLTGIFSALFSLMGGARAIIWTDVIQMAIIYVGITWMFVAVVGHIDGGLAGIWQVAKDHGKDFSYLSDPGYFSWSLFSKSDFWPLFVGFFFNAMAQKGADQLTVQRYLSSPSPRAAARAMWVGVLGSIPIGIIMTLVGLALFAFYKQHPLRIDMSATGVNGVFPHYMVTELPVGLVGLLVAVIVAAITSTVNSGLQCLATVTLTDFQMRFGKRRLTDLQQVMWGRIWTVVWSAITIGLGVFISVTAAENITRVSVAMFGLFAGPSLGIFLLGLLTRRANSWGAGIGALFGAGVTVWVNYFWKNAAGDSVCFAWPVVFGVGATCISGYAVSRLFPAPRPEQINGLVALPAVRSPRAGLAPAGLGAVPPES